MKRKLFIEDYFKTDAEKISETIYGFKPNKRTNTIRTIILLGIFVCAIMLGMFGFSSCSTLRNVKPIENNITEIIQIRDSIVFRDSVVVIPIERIVDIVPQYDTLCLETSLAKAISYVDTTHHVLKGSIENKKSYTSKTEEKIKYIEKTDTLKIIEYVPYEVVKYKNKIPGWYKTIVIVAVVLFFIFGIYIRGLFKI